MNEITFRDLLGFVDSCHRDFQVTDVLAELAETYKVHKTRENEKAVNYIRTIGIVDRCLITRRGYYRIKKRYVPIIMSLGKVIKKGGEKNEQ